MAGDYIVLGERQTDWMRKTMKNMVELTAYYSFAKQPLGESDYENIAGAFSNYTKKSRNNAIVIQSAAAFTEYLDELAKKQSTIPVLNEAQMRELWNVTDELFDVTTRSLGETGVRQEEVDRLIDMCGQNLGEHMLLADIKKIFKDYAAFCIKQAAMYQAEPDKAQVVMTKQRCAKGR